MNGLPRACFLMVLLVASTVGLHAVEPGDLATALQYAQFQLSGGAEVLAVDISPDATPSAAIELSNGLRFLVRISSGAPNMVSGSDYPVPALAPIVLNQMSGPGMSFGTMARVYRELLEGQEKSGLGFELLSDDLIRIEYAVDDLPRRLVLAFVFEDSRSPSGRTTVVVEPVSSVILRAERL